MKNETYSPASAADAAEEPATEREKRVAEERRKRRAARRRKLVIATLLTILIAESAAALGFLFHNRLLPAEKALPFLENLPLPEISLPVNLPPFFTKAVNAPDTEQTAQDGEEQTAELSAASLPSDADPRLNETLTTPPDSLLSPSPTPTPRFALYESRATKRLYPPAAPAVMDNPPQEIAESAENLSAAPENPVETAGAIPETLPESQYIVLIDADTGEILAARDSWKIVPPASMTKVLTLLVAAEHLGSFDRLNDLVGVTKEVTNYCYVHDCSVAGFAAWETVTVRDLLYGLILPSGADAALALSRYIAGSHEAFVELMNEKLEELGIAQTAHFTNCIGLYDPDHACTVKDIAVIMRAAMRDPVCKAVLRARTYRTSSTAEHPNGILLSNLFLRRIEDRFEGSDLYINGGKTGFVNQSGSCAVSSAARDDGRRFICVTANAPGSWRVIYDHTLIYQTLLP